MGEETKYLNIANVGVIINSGLSKRKKILDYCIFMEEISPLLNKEMAAYLRKAHFMDSKKPKGLC